MRVLIDATPVLLRSAGVKSYIYHWIRALRAANTSIDIQAFPMLGDFGGLHHQGSVISKWQTLPRLGLLYALNAPGSPLLDSLLGDADLFHVTNQVRVRPKRVPVTATIHDLTCWFMPELHTAANVRADFNFAEKIWKNANRLIAVSENTRQDAIRELGVSPDRVETIYSGIPEAYFDAKPSPAARGYVLYVGTVEPRKNLDRLLDGWHLVKASVRAEYELVVAGPAGWSSESVMRRLQSGIPGVRYAGYVPESELPGLTAGATAFIYPSLYEGFGFPVAQAMACGVPVITSNNSCLPEVAGEAAEYVDPYSGLEIASALERVLTSPSLRQRLGATGRERAQRYRWETCAEKSLRFFQAALG